jgi:hypothetical protein
MYVSIMLGNTLEHISDIEITWSGFAGVLAVLCPTIKNINFFCIAQRTWGPVGELASWV